jgi:outer membrane protein OmpA-like peptidoglycan-associated protein
VKQGRTTTKEDGGNRTVIHETDNRVIINQNNTTIIRHDETQRFAKSATNVRSERRSDGLTQTVIVQPGGRQIFNIVDDSGRLVHRYRNDERGREVSIIDNRSFYRNAAIIGVGVAVAAIALNLRQPEVRIPRERYIRDYERASDDDIYETLTAPPVERLERVYSLEEVRYSHQLRDRMPRVDLDAVTFPSGAWEVSDEQFSKLERVAKVLNRVIDRDPREVFMIEGHTDAVGTDVDNLTLSDRRAQAVAEILTGVFRVPAENLVTQGYGEQYLKIPTANAERANRRVAVRRITPLMAENR